MKIQKSYIPKKTERVWVQVDASADSLGRVATKIANLLRGKHKRDFTPHIDGGDFVVAINAGRMKITGKKVQQKVYRRYSGYPGGLRTKPMKNILSEKPEEVLRRAVFNMLDDNKLRKTAMRRLKIAAGSSHEFKIDKKA